MCSHECVYVALDCIHSFIAGLILNTEHEMRQNERERARTLPKDLIFEPCGFVADFRNDFQMCVLKLKLEKSMKFKHLIFIIQYNFRLRFKCTNPEQLASR